MTRASSGLTRGFCPSSTPAGIRRGAATILLCALAAGVLSQGVAATYDFGDGTRLLRLNIPASVTTVRGIVIHGNGANENRTSFATDPELVAYAESLGFAVLATGYWGNFTDPNEFVYFEQQLGAFATASGHAELVHAPWLPLGHSNGGAMSYGFNHLRPEKVIAFITSKAGYYITSPPSDAALRTPGLLISGELDQEFRRVNNRALFTSARPRGALWSWVEEEATGHSEANSQHLKLAFLAECCRLRYPADQSPANGPVTLRDLVETSGWLVDHTTWRTGLTAIHAYADAPGDKRAYGWVPNEYIAMLYRAFSSYQKPCLSVAGSSGVVDAPADLSYSAALSVGDWRKIEFFLGTEKIGEVSGSAAPAEITHRVDYGGFQVFHALVTLADNTRRPTYLRRAYVRGPLAPASPAIVLQPADAVALLGDSATFTTQAIAQGPLSYRWQRRPVGSTTWENLTDDGRFSGTATAAICVHATARSQDGDQFRCTISNGIAPDANSQPATMVVAKAAASVTIGATSFVYDGSSRPVVVSTNPAGLGVAVTYAGAATPPSAAGVYTVVATVDDADFAGSASATLSIAPLVALDRTLPVASTAGGSATLGATASGGTHTIWQWQVQRAGAGWVDISGATAPTLTIPSAQLFHTGSYRAVATMSGAAAASDGVSLVVDPATASDSRLLNLSTRALCLQGDDVLIPGFVISGTSTKRLLLRAVGPELMPFGIASPLPDPRLVLKRKVGEVYIDHATNDDWGTNTNLAEIIAAANSVCAFGLTEGSTSSALLLDLPAGQYTVIASDTGTGTGIGIVELYDADPASSGTRLINISNRGYVGTGNDLMIPGFVVSPEGPKTFLIRAVGPTLVNWGVTGVLSDPQLAIRRREVDSPTDQLILTNDNWGENGDATDVAATASRVYAFALPGGSRDAAFVVTLLPGIYTVHVSGVNNTTGTALVEIYVAT